MDWGRGVRRLEKVVGGIVQPPGKQSRYIHTTTEVACFAKFCSQTAPLNPTYTHTENPSYSFTSRSFIIFVLFCFTLEQEARVSH